MLGMQMTCDHLVRHTVSACCNAGRMSLLIVSGGCRNCCKQHVACSALLRACACLVLCWGGCRVQFSSTAVREGVSLCVYVNMPPVSENETAQEKINKFALHTPGLATSLCDPRLILMQQPKDSALAGSRAVHALNRAEHSRPHVCIYKWYALNKSTAHPAWTFNLHTV